MHGWLVHLQFLLAFFFLQGTPARAADLEKHVHIVVRAWARTTADDLNDYLDDIKTSCSTAKEPCQWREAEVESITPQAYNLVCLLDGTPGTPSGQSDITPYGRGWLVTLPDVDMFLEKIDITYLTTDDNTEIRTYAIHEESPHGKLTFLRQGSYALTLDLKGVRPIQYKLTISRIGANEPITRDGKWGPHYNYYVISLTGMTGKLKTLQDKLHDKQLMGIPLELTSPPREVILAKLDVEPVDIDPPPVWVSDSLFCMRVPLPIGTHAQRAWVRFPLRKSAAKALLREINDVDCNNLPAWIERQGTYRCEQDVGGGGEPAFRVEAGRDSLAGVPIGCDRRSLCETGSRWARKAAPRVV